MKTILALLGVALLAACIPLFICIVGLIDRIAELRKLRQVDTFYNHQRAARRDPPPFL